jgi:2-keto-4-pentenoate hydratase
VTLSDELIALHESPRQVPRFSERFAGLTPEEGYAAANALHAHRLGQGWRAVGRKIGFTNRTIWPRYGVYEPIWGTVYDRTLSYAQEDRASVSLAGLIQPRIEPEICFHLKAPPASSDPQALLECIDWVAHSIEIVQCLHPQWKLNLADSIAANGLHGKLVIGTPLAIERLTDPERTLPALQVVLRKNGRDIDQGSGENVLGSPLLALAYFVEVLKKQPHAPELRAGEIVTTGTITDAHPVAPGEAWSTELSGVAIPGLTIRFQ